MKAGEKWNDGGIVFANNYGGFLRPDTVLDAFRQLLKEAGLPPMRFHDLRHSAATILFVAGVNPKVIQELLGHSTISITLEVYSHVLPSMQQEAAVKWMRYLRSCEVRGQRAVLFPVGHHQANPMSLSCKRNH